jgi:hypothetical protein
MPPNSDKTLQLTPLDIAGGVFYNGKTGIYT